MRVRWGSRWRHRVVPGRPERPAAQQPADRQPLPRQRPWTRYASRAYVEHDGREPARRRAPGAGGLVPVDQPNCPRRGWSGHRRAWRWRSLSSVRRSRCAASANVCLLAAGVAPISSQPWSGAPARRQRRATIARSCRRSRLRRVAEPIERPIAKATRNGTAVGIVEKGAPQGLSSGRATGSGQRLERPASADRSRSSREPGAALEPPGLDDRPTGTGAHAGAKAVLAGSTASVRLVCALHDFSTFSDISTSN